MAYKAEQVKDTLQEGITLMNEIGGKDLYDRIKNVITDEINSGRISANLKEDVLKSGGMLFGTKAPLIVLSNKNPQNQFYDIGICVNGNTVSFLLLGESTEDNKNKKKEFLLNNGNKLKASFIKVDVLKLQEERAWQQTIMNYMNQYFE